MIIITGAAGFIGSNLAGFLNKKGIEETMLVDAFDSDIKNRNIANKKFTGKIPRDFFFEWFDANHHLVDYVFHLGARTDTAEFNKAIFDTLNLGYSKKMWLACSKYSVPLIYASSAATYGDGEQGYNDDHRMIRLLKPLNPYGESKNEFDKWVLNQEETPPFWAGLKFFNVYGPNEYHKGRMASVVFHSFNQIMQTKNMKLFRSHKTGIPDGEQRRDFISVRDVVDVIYWLFKNKADSGIYNLGTGKARTFLDLAKSTFLAMGLKPSIEFIDTPSDIKDKYQYFTEARMEKLRQAGYTKEFITLEDGINDYVKNYLLSHQYY